MIEWNILLGAIAGIVWAGIGYAVAKAKTDEEFEPKNFATTVIIGIVLAAIATVMGTDLTTAGNYTVVQLLTIIIDKIIGVAQRGEI